MFFTIYAELCHKIGRSPSWVAQELGINKATVTYWKNNPTAKPSNETMCKIADFFNVTVDYLSGKENSNRPITDINSIRFAAYNALEDESEEFAQDVLNYINFKKSQKKKED